MLSEDLVYTLFWHLFPERRWFPLISVFCLTPSLVKIKLMMNQSGALALPPVWGEGVPAARRPQRSLSHRFVICVSRWNRLERTAELRNSMLLQPAAHKSLRVLILRRLKMKTHPDSSTHFIFQLWPFICRDFYCIFVNFLRFQACVFVDRHSWALSAFSPF